MSIRRPLISYRKTGNFVPDPVTNNNLDNITIVMVSKDVLRGLYAISQLKEEAFWDSEFDPESQGYCQAVVDHFETELVSNQDTGRFLQITRAFVEDIFSYKAEHPQHAVISDFLQFITCSCLCYYLVNNKLVGYAYDWLANSLDETISSEPVRTVQNDRIYRFIVSDHPFIQQELANVLGIWVYSLFYYSRMIGGHIPTITEFLKSYGSFYFSLPARGAIYYEFTQSISQILAWCIEYNNQEWIDRCVAILLHMYNDPAFRRDWKKDVVMQLSCLDRELTGQPQTVWCGMLLDSYADLLRGHQRMHVWVNYTAGSSQSIIANMSVILKAIDEYHESLNASTADKSLLAYELIQIYSIIFPTIMTLLKDGHTVEAEKLFAYYFRITDPQDGVLHIIPNDREGVVYSTGESCCIIPVQNLRQSSIDMTVRINAFLQVANTIKGYPDYQPAAVDPERHGTPLEGEANTYLEHLRRHFQFPAMAARLAPDNVRGYYLHNGINHPIQPILLADTGKCLPLSLSFQMPEPARKIRKVLLWEGDSLFSPHECEGLKQILNGGGVKTEVLNYRDHGITDFIAAYESDDYDCILISGHGVYNHYEPHASYIHLSEGLQLDLDQINALQNNWKERRLLFLNICDGATTALHNSPLSIGIGTHLVHAKQSLFSHLWPVNPRIAFLMSWLVVAGIVQGKPYDEVYKTAVLTLRSGKEAVYKYLKDFLDEETASSVLNVDIDLSNFTHWGSLAYFE